MCEKKFALICDIFVKLGTIKIQNVFSLTFLRPIGGQ